MNLIAHTATVIEHSSLAYRIVLMDKGSEYVVWYEYFDRDNPEKHLGYDSGHYFPVRGDGQKIAFQKAYAKYSEKAQKIETIIADGNFIEKF